MNKTRQATMKASLQDVIDNWLEKQNVDGWVGESAFDMTDAAWAVLTAVLNIQEYIEAKESEDDQ